MIFSWQGQILTGRTFQTLRPSGEENPSCLTSCHSRGSPPKWQDHGVAWSSLQRISSWAVEILETPSPQRGHGCECASQQSIREASLCWPVCVYTYTLTRVIDATVGEDQISDFGSLHAGVLPLGGDFVRCQTEMGRAYQRRLCPWSIETVLHEREASLFRGDRLLDPRLHQSGGEAAQWVWPFIASVEEWRPEAGKEAQITDSVEKRTTGP